MFDCQRNLVVLGLIEVLVLWTSLPNKMLRFVFKVVLFRFSYQD